MPRRKAVTTYARELAKSLTPDQLRELSAHILEAAEKPQLDKKAHAKAQKAIKTAHNRLQTAEENLASLLAEAGHTNAEINEEIRTLKLQADKERMAQRSE